VIWELLQKPITVAQIAGEVTRKFEVSAKQSLADVLLLLNRMREANLIEVREQLGKP